MEHTVEQLLALLPRGYSLTKTGDSWEVRSGEVNCFGESLYGVLHRFLVVMWGEKGLMLGKDIYIPGDAVRLGGWGKICEISYSDIQFPTFKVQELPDSLNNWFDFFRYLGLQDNGGTPGGLPEKDVRVQIKPKKISVDVVDDLKQKIKDLFPKDLWNKVLAEQPWLDGDYIKIFKRVLTRWELQMKTTLPRDRGLLEEDIKKLFTPEVWGEVKDRGFQSLLGVLSDAIWLTRVYAVRESKKENIPRKYLLDKAKDLINERIAESYKAGVSSIWTKGVPDFKQIQKLFPKEIVDELLNKSFASQIDFISKAMQMWRDKIQKDTLDRAQRNRVCHPTKTCDFICSGWKYCTDYEKSHHEEMLKLQDEINRLRGELSALQTSKVDDFKVRGECRDGEDCVDCPDQDSCVEQEMAKHRKIQLLNEELNSVKQELSACKSINGFRGHTVSEWAGIASDYQIQIHDLQRQITELKEGRFKEYLDRELKNK